MTEVLDVLSKYFGEEVARKLLDVLKIEKFYPTQEAAIKSGVLDGESIVLAAPTASGKTLIAVLAALRHLVSGGKALYLAPLRALAAEKYQEFREVFSPLGYKVALSTGDYDSSDPELGKYDVIITTNEKADSLLRHKAPWFSSISLVVADEIHVVGLEKRGAVLEMLLTRIRSSFPNVQLLGLSATVRNLEEIASWLGAKPVRVDWRPVKLREGVYYDGAIYFHDGGVKEVETREGALVDLVLDTLEEGGQALVFSPTRRAAVSDARRVSAAARKFLSEREHRLLAAAAARILQSHSDKVSEELANLVKSGVAFHHAGLSSTSRSIVEQLFRERVLKVVVATPTLSAGVNLPAKRVVITDYRRYNVELGYHERISVMEYKQMAGRAGRPKYDLEGEAVLIARTAREVEFLMKEYVAASPERIFSQLGSEQVLRSQVLSLVATEDSIKDEKSLKSVFSRTLFSAQFSPLAAEAAVEKVTRWLLSTGFLERTGARIRATAVGKRVAELYIDPMTAHMGLEFFKSKKRCSTLSYLFLLASTPDMTAISVRKEDIDKLEELLQSRGEELPSPPEDEVEYEWYLSRLKTALLLEDWINEVREDIIVERYDVGPGDIYSLTQTAEWVAYSLSQVAEVAGFPEHSANLSILSKRIKHGVREELLELVSLRGIGRVRARSLFNHGFKSLYDLVTASERDLARVPGIGPSLARAIKAQLQGGAEAGEEREVLEEASGQSQLDEYLYPH